MLDLKRGAAWERWQAAAGPWRGWAICPALAAPDTDGAELVAAVPSRMAVALAQELAIALSRGRTATVLDLDPLIGIRVAAQLYEDRLAHAVLVLPRWPYAEAVLSVEGLLATAIAESRRLAHGADLANVVFVLDADRNRPIPARSARDRRADNRYRLGPADLPRLADLRRAGIDRVVKISRV